MDTLSLYHKLILIVVFLMLSGFFSMSESSLFSLGRHQRERLKKSKAKSANLIESLLKDPYKLIITILAADEVLNVSFTSVIASTMSEIATGISDEVLLAVISICIASPALLLFGEITPKTIGIKYPRFLASLIVYPLSLFHKLILPIRWIIMVLSIGITHLLGGRTELHKEAGFNPDDVKALVWLGTEEGVITEIEKKLVRSLFHLEEVPAYKIMTPNIKIFSLSADTAVAQGIVEIKNRGFSRIPVYKDNKDNVIGILYAKDILEFGADLTYGMTLERFIRPPYFIPRTKKAFDLFREFQIKRIHMAVLVDEYGRVDGLVTMQDILEELFGEIEDERRVDIEPQIKREGEALIIPGSMKIDDFNEDLLFTVLRPGGIEKLAEGLEESILPSRDHETVGGFAFSLFGRLPQEGEKISQGKILFTVHKVLGTRIAELKVERIKEEVEDVG